MLLTRRFIALLVSSAVTLILVSFLQLSNKETELHHDSRPGAGLTLEPEIQPVQDHKEVPTKAEGNNEDVPPAATFLHGTLKGTVSAILYSTSSEDETPTTISTISSLPAVATPTGTEQSSGKLRIAITETGGSHDEVVAALAYAFGSQNGVELTLYMLLKRYRIAEVIESFRLETIKPLDKSSVNFPEHFSEDNYPQIVVAATCELDLFRTPVKRGLQYLVEKGQTHLFCVIHHADRWAQQEKEEALRPWIEKQKITFLTLSEHTANYFRKAGMSGWHIHADSRVRYFVPVFPAPPPVDSPAEEEDQLAFAMQGDFDPSRRDYEMIFRELDQFLHPQESGQGDYKSPGRPYVANTTNVALHLLGHGDKPSVPEAVAEHVYFDEGLSYRQYYDLLSRTIALLPAFANSEYLDRKASSSVPAALIGGTPLVASQEILNAYSYLPRDAVWVQEEDETDMDVVARVLQMPAEDRRRQREMVRKRCAGILEGNIRWVGRWIKEAIDQK